MTTNPLFLTDTYLFATLVNILAIGTDEIGHFFVSDSSIFYPQGGGQPNDDGFITTGNGGSYAITAARYADNGVIKHYLENELPRDLVDRQVAMRIIQETRNTNAAFHTAGHWLSQIVLENLELPLTPVKGHHFPGEAYIEFQGDPSCLSENTIDQIAMASGIDRQSDLSVRAELGSIDSDIFRSALLPTNFKPPANKPLRFVMIEGYKPIPCGGTHLRRINDLKSVTPLEFYKKKGDKLRLKYTCEAWTLVAD